MSNQQVNHESPAIDVSLIDYVGAGSPDPSRRAANLLVFTKQTRLQMDSGLMREIEAMSLHQIHKELDYMAKTIPSSWEFVNYVFLIKNVTRAFTHQFVRTRTGSYAQQTMRVLNVDGWSYATGPSIEGDPELQREYSDCMDTIGRSYASLQEQGAATEDARGALPTNIHTNIVARFNLRDLAEMSRKRASHRTQGEYREVLSLMRFSVLRAHPWASLFLDRTFDKVAAELEAGLLEEKLAGNIGAEKFTNLTKLLDQLRAAA